MYYSYIDIPILCMPM